MKMNLCAPTYTGAYFLTSRKADYFRGELSANSSTGAIWLTITNVAVLKSGNTDIVTNTIGKTLVAKTPETITHDLDGNLTSDGEWTQTWNAENRTITVESVSTLPAAAKKREQGAYLQDGRWIERVVSTNNGTGYFPAFTNRYVWDGQVLLAVLNHTNGLVLSFMRGLDLSGTLQGAGGVGGLVAVTGQSTINNQPSTHFASFDGNGNVMTLVGAANGTLTAQYEYGPFAEPIRCTGPMALANPIRFSTQYADDVTSDMKYLFRDYRSRDGRWLSRDPLAELGFGRIFHVQSDAELDGAHPMVFVMNSSLNMVDAYGLITFKGCAIKDEIRMARAFSEYCSKIQEKFWCRCMLNSGLRYALHKICNASSLQIICDKKQDKGNCKDACGWTHLFRTIDNRPIIHLCPDGVSESNGCPGVGCTIIHEMTHTTNWSNNETWAQKTEACAGCPPTDLFPNGPPPFNF